MNKADDPLALLGSIHAITAHSCPTFLLGTNGA
jgi:hypothetical protein